MNAEASASTRPQLVSWGVPALDLVCGGGLTPHRFYMVQGVPGSGKTTLALQFLLDGARLGEPVLYVTLSETEEEISALQRRIGDALKDGFGVEFRA